MSLLAFSNSMLASRLGAATFAVLFCCETACKEQLRCRSVVVQVAAAAAVQAEL